MKSSGLWFWYMILPDIAWRGICFEKFFRKTNVTEEDNAKTVKQDGFPK